MMIFLFFSKKVLRTNSSCGIINWHSRLNDGALEKRLTHMPFTHAFTGSNPVRVTIFGGLAQLGEHLPYKQRVSGSSPLASTIKIVFEINYRRCRLSSIGRATDL